MLGHKTNISYISESNKLVNNVFLVNKTLRVGTLEDTNIKLIILDDETSGILNKGYY